MDKRAALDIVARFQKGIEARGIRPHKIILYGSYAAGTNREGSDIDVVVVSDDFASMSYWERIDLLSDVIYEIFAPVEVVVFTCDEWERGDSFVADFARHGEVLFAA
jgi:predicted nucleotidyltransferase